METELGKMEEKMDWILAEIRKSLEDLRETKEESEWETVAKAGESWE
jgi:hypothetical protein